MKMNVFQLGSQEIETTSGFKKMRLSENAASMVFQLFTKNVYSNPIGTIIREITSNCFDSHVEANVDLPVIIRKDFDNKTQQHHISFIDSGVGMSPDRVENIYGVYFESTKRIDNTQIGGFGIGGKTPLAYKRIVGVNENEYDNSFYVITIYNNVKYYYVICEGSESPIISLLHKESTDERNGTEVRIPILERDIKKFTSEMVKQLYYFENVIFEGFNLDNDYQIIKGEHFLYRGTSYSNQMHVCLGKVTYPINYSVLGLNEYDYTLPIALKLEVGDVNVTVSREHLDYSETTIKMIKMKLELAKNEIKELFNKQYSNVRTLEDYLKVNNKSKKLEFQNGMSLYVGRIINERKINYSNFKYNSITIPNNRELFDFFFTTLIGGKKNKRNFLNNDYVGLKPINNLYYVEGEYKRQKIKLEYLKELHETYYIIKRNNILVDSLTIRNKIAQLFNIDVNEVINDKGDINPAIQPIIDLYDEYYEIIKRIVKDYNKIEIPKSFIERRNILTDNIRETTFPVKVYHIYSSKYARLKLGDLINFSGIIFYGDTDEEYLIFNAIKAFSLLFGSKHIVTNPCEYYYNNKHLKIHGGIMFLRLSKVNVKYMKHCPNAHSIVHFKTKMLYRKEEIIINSFKHSNIINRFYKLNKLYSENHISYVSNSWGDKIQKLINYINKIKEDANVKILGFENVFAKYYDINEIRENKTQKNINAIFNDVCTLQNVNEDILEHIHLPYYRLSEIRNNKTLINILKKVMVL